MAGYGRTGYGHTANWRRAETSNDLKEKLCVFSMSLTVRKIYLVAANLAVTVETALPLHVQWHRKGTATAMNIVGISHMLQKTFS